MPLTQMLFSAQGRIRRSQYWLWSIVTFVAYYVLCFLIGFVLGAGGILKSGDTTMANLVVLPVVPLYIWVSVCITAKRWHDRDKSGWMYLILLIPLVGAIWSFVECGCLDGTHGRNKYGPSPKGIGNESNVF